MTEPTLRDVLADLERRATVVSRRGTEAGPQWVGLTISLLAARQALQRPEPNPEDMAGIVDLMERLVGILVMADASSGFCGCGESMTDHLNPMDAGHAPVDYGSYVAGQVIQEAEAMIATLKEKYHV